MSRKIASRTFMGVGMAVALLVGISTPAQAAALPTATVTGGQAQYSYDTGRLYVQDQLADGKFAWASIYQWDRQAATWVYTGITVSDENGANGDSPSVKVSGIKHDSRKGNLQIRVCSATNDQYLGFTIKCGYSGEFRLY